MGGTVRTVLNVANYLAENNYNIEIVSVLRRRAKEFFEIDPRIKVTVLHDEIGRNKRPKDIKSKVINRINKSKSRLIHSDDEAFSFFSLLTDIKLYNFIKSIDSGILITTRPSFNIFASKYANKNVVLVGQEHLNFGIYPEKLKESIQKHYTNLDYLITLTDDDTKDYDKIFSGSGVIVRKITNSIPKFTGAISKLNEKVVLAAGRLAPQKGFDMLIEAFSKVNKYYPDWKLKIFGFGREKNNLQQLISDYRLYNHVYLMGATQDMESELSKSSIYALSSRFEGFGMVIVEAMQCGVPVVSFDCPKGPAEIISNNIDGILVENGDVDAFADALIELIGNEEKRRQLAENALVNVKRFEIENIGKLWIDLINEIEQNRLSTKILNN